SKDDVTLLLLGGATQEKMIALIGQRGVDFQMNPDLAKKFHDAGASDEVIEALTKAGVKPKAAAPAPSSQAPAASPTTTPSASAPAATTPPATPSPSATSPAASSQPPSKPAGVDLGDPSPEQTQKIIQEFAAKEELFKEARNNYTYHQTNKVQTLDADGSVDG